MSAVVGSGGAPPGTQPRISARTLSAMLLLLAVGTGLLLRLFRISLASLWSDEIFSAFWVGNGLSLIWGKGFEIETTPPLYYTLLKGWTAVFGTSEAGLRGLSAVLSAATIPLVGFTMVKDLSPANVAEFQKFIDFSSDNKILTEKVDVTKFMIKFD